MCVCVLQQLVKQSLGVIVMLHLTISLIDDYLQIVVLSDQPSTQYLNLISVCLSSFECMWGHGVLGST